VQVVEAALDVHELVAIPDRDPHRVFLARVAHVGRPRERDVRGGAVLLVEGGEQPALEHAPDPRDLLGRNPVGAADPRLGNVVPEVARQHPPR
jgi:hypothetical protein